MKQNDGGPAFPCPESNGDDHEGMSLRDYFAAKAMHAELNTAGAFIGPAKALADAAQAAGRSIEQQIAFNSYELADAMIAARLK